MELDNNTGLAASQTYCCTCQGSPPTYESTIASQSGGRISENNVNTVLPPEYSALDTESYVGDWGFHRSQAFWIRIIKRRGKVWFQYSIEKNNAIPWAGNGRRFFTCGMMPRERHDEASVRKTCEAVIVLLKAHRGDCQACEVQHVQTGRSVCVPSISGQQFGDSMARHDMACSCRCFDVHYPPQQAPPAPAASGSTLQETEEYQHYSLDPSWESEVRNGQTYWFRTIQRGGNPRFQCGISTNQGPRRHEAELDLFFTCRMMPRVGHTQGTIGATCKAVALALKTHRTTRGDQCGVCDFRHVEGKRMGCPANVFSTSRAQLLHKMKCHDEACSCRCFHVDMNGRPTIENTTGPSQPHRQTRKQVARQELEVREDRPDQEWESAPGRFNPKHFYWTRTIKNGDDIWHQHGVSRRPSDDGPEFFFTCKMKPRRKGHEPAMLELCKELASHMRAHRSANYDRCTCNFQTWRNRGGSGGCRVSWYHLDTRVTRYLIGVLMQRHDVLCSCGCFDVETGEMRLDLVND